MKTLDTGRQILSLDGDAWRLTQATKGENHLPSDTEWFPATVPGAVHLDLARAGQLPDLRCYKSCGTGKHEKDRASLAPI